MKNKNSTTKNKRRGFFVSMVDQVRTNRTSFIVFCILRVLVIAVIIRSVLTRQWESVFVAVLTLVLFLIPPFIEKNFRIQLPTVLESMAFVFVFCAEILGEIECYYLRVPFWDTALHTVNGFMFAAFGFCLVDLFNREKKFRFELSPFFLAIVAFCFSMTIGILWEFFECFADQVLLTDMQKDFFVNTISTVSLNEEGLNRAVILRDIQSTAITLSDGSQVTFSGYLDIGLLDTMKDLFVNFIGAVVFSVIGFFYVKQRGRGKIARQFIPVVESYDSPVSDDTTNSSQCET